VITLGSAKRIYFDTEMGDALTEALDEFAATSTFALSSDCGHPVIQSSF